MQNKKRTSNRIMTSQSVPETLIRSNSIKFPSDPASAASARHSTCPVCDANHICAVRRPKLGLFPSLFRPRALHRL